MEGKKYFDASTRKRGFTTYCGLEFTTTSEDLCVISCPLRQELMNPAGIVHGGLTATIMDVASGTLALMADGNRHGIVTQSCNIHYLRPAKGDVLRAESHLLRKGRRICVVQADCFCDDRSDPVATAIYEIAYVEEGSLLPTR